MKAEKEEIYKKLATTFLDELIWMASALKWGRENLSSKYH
jgi:hypothetical protein